MRFLKVIVIFSLCMCLITNNAFASSPEHKLLRGLANILTGWVEIPKNIYDTAIEDNIFSALTLGLVRGIGMAIIRTGAGIYEIVTFPFPVPEDYAPIMEPEYVFSD